MDKQLISKINFSIEPVKEIQEINSIISKARVRIFYTGLNRNLTYITEEFAEKLLKTLPYTPVGGLWKEEKKDFSDHGGAEEENREKFQAFGVVPENPNVAWEAHTDSDGVLRKYACCDVYLWTARYKAAREIPKKSQSMELYMHSIKGQWKRHGAVEYFEFTDGCFFGLTALGDNVEPCFEGAAFYNVDPSAKEFFEELKNYTLSATKEHIGGIEMEKELKTKVEKTPVVENDAVEATVEETTEETTVEQVSTEEGAEDKDTVEEVEQEGETTETIVEENTETIPATEETTDVNVENEENNEEITSSNSEEVNTNQEVENNEADIKTNYEEQISELKTQILQYEETISNLNKTIEEFTSYRNQVEKSKKEELINKYSSLLKEEDVNNYLDKIDSFSIEELKKEISVKILDTNEDTLFNKNETRETITDVNITNVYSGAARLMNKYFANK